MSLKEQIESLEAANDERNGVTYKVMEVTPQMAVKWLEGNTANRSISDARVAAYASDMAAGRWRLNNQGIAFGADGTLYDGQHRLWAVVKSGTPIQVLVVRGLNEEVRSTIDKLRPRRIADDLRMLLGVENSNRMFARISAISYLLNPGGQGHGKPQLTYAQTLEVMARYRSGLNWSLETFTGGKPIDSAPVAGMMAYAHKADPEKIATFGLMVRDGINLQRDTAAWALRGYVYERLARIREDRRVTYRKVLRMALAHLKKEKVTKVSDSQEGVLFFARANGDLRQAKDAVDAVEAA